MSKKIVEYALKNKINVITPNKALIAKHGDYLAKLAELHRVNLEFEAAVAGGIQFLELLRKVWLQTKSIKFMEFLMEQLIIFYLKWKIQINLLIKF